MEEFFRRRKDNQAFYYGMIGAIIVGLGLMIGGTIYVFSL